jgi:O-antigen/teichoic acid export membrane protein
VIWCVFNVQDGTIIGMRKSVWVPIENTIYGTLKLALLIVFLYVFPQYGIFLSWIIPILVVIAIVNFFIFRYLIPAHVHATTEIARPITLAQVATYAGGNYAGMIFSLTNTMLPPIMVLQLAGSRASAYFYMPWVMVSFFRSLATDTSLVLVVEGTTDQSRLTQLFRSAIFNTARLVIPAVIGCVIIAPYILRIFGEDYANEGTALFRLLSFAAIPNIVVTLYMGWLRAKNNIGSVTIMQFIIAVLSLPLSYIWLRSYGIMGVGMALLVVQTIIAVVLLLFPLRFMFARPFVAQRAE